MNAILENTPHHALDFYHKLKPLVHFRNITDEEYFLPLPEDWLVIITDVIGSTQAIEEGRYRDVNIVGIAGLVAVKNALGGADFPYIFGGDGVSMLLPASLKDKAEQALLSMQHLATQNFNLGLRVGVIKASEIVAKGGKITMGKLHLVGGQSLAVVSGGGVSLAEKIIKANPSTYAPIPPKGFDAKSQEVDLTGLSCRWQPIKPLTGTILTLLVKRQSSQSHAYHEFLDGMYKIFYKSMKNANPVKITNMAFQRFSALIKDEKRYYLNPWQFDYVMRIITDFMSGPLFRWPMSLLHFYTKSMAVHSDYRKFDDAFRMVLDCTPTQANQIKTLLETLRQEGKIHYGLHESQSALMTCYVPNIGEGKHVHFIDGNDGGYALAAKQLKAQMAKQD